MEKDQLISQLVELLTEREAGMEALVERLTEALIGGDDALLAKLPLEDNITGSVPLWPREWVEYRGGILYPKPGAPTSARILPVSMTGAITTFTLRSADRLQSGEPTETVTPDLSDEAHVARWLGTRYRVGASLFAYNSSATTASTLTCWFYFHRRRC